MVISEQWGTVMGLVGVQVLGGAKTATKALRVV